MNTHKESFKIYGRPVITNIKNLYTNVNNKCKLTILGLGFWSNSKSLILSSYGTTTPYSLTAAFTGIETNSLQAPLFGKTIPEVVRTFVIPPTSGNIFSQSVSSYDLYSHMVCASDTAPTLSTKYPAFTGIEINHTITSENNMTMNLPVPSAAGIVDIIIANRAGYSRASTDIYQSTDNTASFDTNPAVSSNGRIVVQ